MRTILGIESSCDETAAAITIDGYKVKSNVVASQIDKHAVYGGVVPELAAREHLTAVKPVIDTALKYANVKPEDIDAVAVTNGPGLMPALLVGVNFARGLSQALNCPLIGINHFFAHIYAAFLDDGAEVLKDKSIFPMVSLVVSGGHTAIVLIEESGKSTVIGTTIDDAAGEALDKGAKLLDLGYPGGPIVDKLAKLGNKNAFNFPRSLTGNAGKAVSKENTYNFSFSGLKTSLLNHATKSGLIETKEEQLLNDTIASYQNAIVDVLCIKTLKVVKDFNAKSIVLCGGVAQNSQLRAELAQRTPKKVKFILTPAKYCGDNAAMISGLGYHYLRKNILSDLTIDAYSRLPKFSEVPFI